MMASILAQLDETQEPMQEAPLLLLLRSGRLVFVCGVDDGSCAVGKNSIEDEVALLCWTESDQAFHHQSPLLG